MEAGTSKMEVVVFGELSGLYTAIFSLCPYRGGRDVKVVWGLKSLIPFMRAPPT